MTTKMNNPYIEISDWDFDRQDSTTALKGTQIEGRRRGILKTQRRIERAETKLSSFFCSRRPVALSIQYIFENLLFM